MMADFEKGTKVCNKCGMELPVKYFSKKSKSIDGLQSCCKVCMKKYHKTREAKEYLKIRKRNYDMYMDIHKNCIIDVEKLNSLNLTECIEIYERVIKELGFVTNANRCKNIIKYLKNKNKLYEDCLNFTNEQLIKICLDDLSEFYSYSTLNQIKNLVLSSVELVKDIIDKKFEDDEEKCYENIMVEDEMKEAKNNVSIKLKNVGKQFKDLTKGNFFVFCGNTTCLYLKTKETRTNDGKTINACNINTGSLLCVSSDCPVIEMKIDLKAEEV